MTDQAAETRQAIVDRFIATANELRDAGKSIAEVNEGMTIACAVYSTFVAAGGQNVAILREDGIRRVANAYEQILRMVQKAKIAEAKAAGHEVPDDI
ncbi:MAG: DUF3144 domain-containing protein [Chromatiales bacterium]|nr:DUF3144 domain-containing protein [Chromatiales bacterium]